MHTQGEMGVGTLVIFISLLLVAAIAAGVLIQTSTTLQQKALAAGTESTNEVTTKALVTEVSATNGLGNLSNFTMILRLAPGSLPIELNAVTFKTGTRSSTTAFVYSGDESYATTIATQNGTFGIKYLQQGSEWKDGVLSRGDMIAMSFYTQRDMQKGEDVRLSFIPKLGMTTVTQFIIPETRTTERVYLYP
jgi:archaellin